MPPNVRGTVSNALTLNIDLAPTILGAAGLEVPKEMDGRDIADLYLPNNDNNNSSDTNNTDDDKNNIHRTPWRQEFYYEFPNINDKIPPSYALVKSNGWKYIKWWKHNDHEELFDLNHDPVEMNNLANKSEYAGIKNELKQRLEILRHDVYQRGGGWVPGTTCDPMWPSGTDMTKKPSCSPTLPDRCCSPDSIL